MRGKLTALCATLITMIFAFSIGAIDYPTREIRMIIPFAAGGQSDLTARKLAEIIQKYKLLPQPIVVVNMPGANTMNGLNAVLDAKPDGYTLLLHHTDMVSQKLYKMIPVHWTDFDMICQVMDINFVISAKGNAPWNKSSEFIADAKKNPGKYFISCPAPGGATYLAGMIYLHAAGLLDDVIVRPTEGGASSATDIMSGTAAIRPAPTSDVARFVKGGQEKVLLLLDNEPRPEFPGTELASTLNLQDTIIKHSSGILAPKNTSDDIKNVVAAAIKAAIETEDFQEFMKFQVCNPSFLTAEQWTERYKRIEKLFSEIIASIAE